MYQFLLLFDTCSPRRPTQQDSHDAGFDVVSSLETTPVGVVAVYIYIVTYTCNVAFV